MRTALLIVGGRIAYLRTAEHSKNYEVGWTLGSVSSELSLFGDLI
jgi:hypothetical protein